MNVAYFPNGSAGEVLDNQCAGCLLGDAGCPTQLVQLMYNYDQIDVPKLREAMEILVSEEGKCKTGSLLADLGLPEGGE